MIFKRLFPGIICAALGAVFIFSALTKLDPIEPFELIIVDLGLSWKVAPFIARFMIGSELFIGALLLINLTLRKLTYKLAISALLLFSLFLIFQIILNGDKGNCGCFGDYFYMTPMQALTKNIVMLVLLGVLYKYHEGWTFERWKAIVLLTLLVVLAIPFIADLAFTKIYTNQQQFRSKLPLDSLHAIGALNGATKELSKGKHIIAFLSITCSHCQTAAKKLRIIKERNPQVPVYFFLNGEEGKLNNFFEETWSENIPHSMLLGPNFIFLAGNSLPVILLVKNSVVENKIHYLDLNEDELKKWISEN